MKKISNSQSEEPIRRSVSNESYVKVFVSSIVLLILGIIIASISSLIIAYADPQTQEAAELILAIYASVGTLSTLLLQIGMVLFSLSFFLGAVRGETLSGDVRKGMAVASAIGILALGVMMVTIVNFPFF